MVDDSRFRYLHDGGHKTAYTVLGVREDAPADVVQAAFRAAAKRSHPDTGKVKDSKAFEEARYAHDLLVDEQRRRAYDAELTATRAAAGEKRRPGVAVDGAGAATPQGRVARYGGGTVAGNFDQLTPEIRARLDDTLRGAEDLSALRTAGFHAWQASSGHDRHTAFARLRDYERGGVAAWEEAEQIAQPAGLVVTPPAWVTRSPLTRRHRVETLVLAKDAALDLQAQVRAAQPRGSRLAGRSGLRTTPRAGRLPRWAVNGVTSPAALWFLLPLLWWLPRELGLVTPAGWLPDGWFDGGALSGGSGAVSALLAGVISLRLYLRVRRSAAWAMRLPLLAATLHGAAVGALLSVDHLFTTAARAAIVAGAVVGLAVAVWQRRTGRPHR